MHSRPSVESSVALRALIHAKRKRGQMTEALVLARLGVRIATQGRIAADRDAMSRMALARYLELMPDDAEVRLTLQQLGPEGSQITPRPSVRRGLLWVLFISCGISATGVFHLNGLPVLFQSAQASVPVATVKLPPVVSASAVAATVKKEVEVVTPIVIRAVGDVVLGSDFPKYRLPGDHDKLRMASLRNELRNADIVVGNLEGVLSDHGKSRKDTSKRGLFTFRMPEGYAATLREMGFDVLSLANNHSMDFGAAGLESTIRALKAENIQAMGVPGAEMAVVKVRDTSVAFLNYSYLPAFARIDDEQRIKAEIKQAHAVADLVVVTVHGGKKGRSPSAHPAATNISCMNTGGYPEVLPPGDRCGSQCGVRPWSACGAPLRDLQRQARVLFAGNFVGYHSLSTRGKLANSIIAEVRFSPQGKLLGVGVIPLKLDRSGIPEAITAWPR